MAIDTLNESCSPLDVAPALTQGMRIYAEIVPEVTSQEMEGNFISPNISFSDCEGMYFLARLHEVHRAIAVTPVVHVPIPVPVPVRVTLALKFFRSPYLDNHSSESIHTWTIDTL